MESRVNKYNINEIKEENTSPTTRSSRNAKLYGQIYSKYENSDNLPIEDNTNEIDMAKLKELVASSNKKEERKLEQDLNVLEQRKRRIDEQKIYDINKIIEKAKYENSKLKAPKEQKTNKRQNLLRTLGSSELSLDEINQAKKRYQEHLKETNDSLKEEELSMTRELKYKNLCQTQENEKESNTTETNNLSLDLFEELKPTGNTITTKPIKSDLEKTKKILNTIQSDIYSSDTSDIDIIKNSSANTKDDFFTNSYEFSKNDFSDIDDEEFFESPKKGGLLKILLLILAIVMFVGVIIYFVGTYGLGIS